MPGDLYATKGIEYLIVVAYMLLMAGVLVFFSRRAPRTVATQAPRPGAWVTQWFALAEGYHFHPGHSWAAATDDDVVTVGLDDFAAQFVGAPDGLELPEVGASIRQGERGWAVRAG